MPALPKTNNPTFNKGQHDGVAVGYHSRIVFSYSSTEPGNVNGTDVVNEGNTDGIQFLIDNSGDNEFHGTHIIPSYYWNSGKTFRVSGTIIIGAPAEEIINPKFNMRFGLNSPSFFSPVWLAIQKNGSDGPPLNQNELPIDFSCDIFCSKVSSDPAGEFGASGYYQYTVSNNTNGGSNLGLVYTPVWKSTLITTGLSGAYTDQSTIMFNLFGTNLGYEIYITRLTIEELA
jgi:hypothetical protein